MNKNGSKWIRPEKRLAIYLRDGFSCVVCGKAADDGHVLSLDHVVPRVDSGTNDSSNLVTLCCGCNSSKQHKDLKQWLIERDSNTASKLYARIQTQVAKSVNVAAGKDILATRKNFALAV